MRCRYHALLQIFGFLAVVAFHSELPGMRHGWVAVELFFALAGYNMARMLQAQTSLQDYVVARYRRLTLPLLWLAPVVLLLVLGSKSALLFAVSAPLQLHNLLRLAMGELRQIDMAWVPSWFVAALFQLQLLVFLVRRLLTTVPVLPLLVGVAGLGLTVRLVLGEILQGPTGVMTFAAADALYWTPLAHVEAIVGGVQIRLGRLLPLRGAFRVAVIALGVLSVLGVIVLLAPSELGGAGTFPLGSAGVGEHVWGYLVLAIAAVALVDKRHFLARWVLSWRLGSRIDAFIDQLSRLTFLGYVLHGGVLAFLTRIVQKSPQGQAFLQSSLGALTVTVCVAFLSLGFAAKLGQLVARVAARDQARRRS